MDTGEWRKKFDEVSKNKPIEGHILTALDGQKIKLTLEFHEGSQPLIFTRIYVPQSVGVEPKWVAQGENENMNFGWKGLLRPKSRDDVIKKFGMQNDFVLVKEVIVTKRSETGKSLQLEVTKWE